MNWNLPWKTWVACWRDAARIEHALICGIEHLRDRQLATMSGGEQQRAALAVLVAMDTDILLLDEPFASIDNHNRTC